MTDTAAIAAIKTYLAQLAGFRMGMRPSGFTYSGAEDYVGDRGRAFDSPTPLTDEEAEYVTDVAERTWGDFATKECFGNAQQLFLHSDGELRYCEGYAIGGAGFPVLHAWVTLNDKVVDLTWRQELEMEPDSVVVIDHDHGTWENRVLGKAPDGWGYFGCDDLPGDTTALRVRLLKHESWMSYLCPEMAIDDDWTARYKLPRLGEEPVDTFAALKAVNEALRKSNS